MIDRLRALLEDPHDPAVARAVVVLASVVTLGLTVVVGIGGSRGSDQEAPSPVRTRSAATTPTSPTLAPARRPAVAHRGEPTQDPQDRHGSVSRRRAARELASHRALQHVPWHGDGVSIRLVGVHGNRAVIGIEAASISEARRGWRGFLRRHHDDGRAYLPRFEARGRR